jgi:NADH:ubiquinone oxidoreductase subunit H
MIALLAEVSRSPFDLPEAEQELTQGFMTEYSAMRFALFMMAEYLGMIAVSMVAVSLYFGGWGIGGGFVRERAFARSAGLHRQGNLVLDRDGLGSCDFATLPL